MNFITGYHVFAQKPFRINAAMFNHEFGLKATRWSN